MKKLNIAILIILTMIIASSCNSKSDSNLELSRTGLEIGTVVSITLYGTEDESIMDGVYNILKEIDNDFSLSIKSSTLNKINENAAISPVSINDDLFNVIDKSLYYSDLSNGMFDISIEPLVALWGIGSDHAKVPTTDEIDSALAAIDYKNIILTDGHVAFNKESTKLDLGAIAKGYAADKIVSYLKDNKIERAIISLGGNVYALGSKSEDRKWNIGIQDPNENRGDIVGSIAVSDKSVVTSGLYERFFEEDGIRYHHILNPKTGNPIENNILGVSIISDKSIDGDALSTITFILGVEKGLELIDTLENVDAIFVTKDSNIYLSSGIKDIFKLTNKNFKLAN